MFKLVLTYENTKKVIQIFLSHHELNTFLDARDDGAGSVTVVDVNGEAWPINLTAVSKINYGRIS